MHKHATLSCLRAALVAVAALFAGASAHADGVFNRPYLGGSVGSTDGFGTALRVFGGAGITHIVGWEASFTGYGDGTYARAPISGAPYTRSANALGLSVLASVPFNNALSGFGKLGLHYLSYDESGPGHAYADDGFEPGLALGLQWHFSPNASARFEVEHVGGHSGDTFLAGIQFRF